MSKYLILVGYGRAGRFDGFERIVVDEAGWRLAQQFRDEYDEDELDAHDGSAALLAALLLMHDGVCADALELDRDALAPLCARWHLLDDSGPFADCRAIIISNTST